MRDKEDKVGINNETRARARGRGRNEGNMQAEAKSGAEEKADCRTRRVT